MTRGLVTDQRVAKILDTNPTAVDQSTAEAELRPPHLNHAACLASSRRRAPAAADHD